MCHNMGECCLLSSDSQKHHSRSFTTVLASTLFEWLLIFMLLVYGVFGYIITRFARYCELPIPCLLCSRIDHNLGSEKAGYYYDMICGKHKLEISSLVYCHFHEKLVDVCGMCESCLFSFATKDKSNAETYRLLVGKLGGEDLSGADDDSGINNNETKGLNMKHCSCCNELFTPRRHAQTLLQTKSIDFDDTDLDLPLSREFSQDRDYFKKETNAFHPSAGVELPLSRDREFSQDRDHLKKESESFPPPADLGRKNDDSLAQFGYSELKVTSDTESDIQMSDAEDTGSLFSTDPLRDLIVDSTSNKPFTSVSENENAYDKRIDLDVLSPKLSETLPLVQADIIGFHDGPSVAPASAIGHGLEELNWQEIDLNLDSSPSTDLMSFNNLSDSPNDVNVSIRSSIANVEEATKMPEKVDVKDSKNLDIKDGGIVMEKVDVKDSKDMDVKEVGVEQTLVHTTEKSQELESLQTTTALNNKKTRSGNMDRNLQIPNYMDLGDAYNLVINGRSRQLSGKLAEQLGGKDSPTVSSDLKLLLSQFSQGSEFLSKDIMSPRVSKNPDDLRAYDSSTSIGMKLLQKRLSLERNDSKSSLDRNESGIESLDFSAVSEIEGESELDRLRRQLEHDRKFLISLLKELEEERNASATSTNETMAMITRLQEEKAALQMEASHDLRMMEEQAEYDMEALDKLNDLVMEKEKEIQDLEAELEYYRTKYPNGSNSENVGASGTSENIIGTPDNLNGVAENTKSDSQDPLIEIETERKHISECLNNLEKKLAAICCSKVSSDLKNGDQSEEQEEGMNDPKLPEDRQVKSETGEDGLSSEKVGFVSTGIQQALLKRVHSFRRSKSAGAEQRALILKEAEIVALVNEVSSLSKRLQALEADQSFIEHSISTLKSGEEGLIQEITSHLRELRKIGIRRHDECNPVKR